MSRWILLTAVTALLCACQVAGDATTTLDSPATTHPSEPTMKISSPAFAHEGQIPATFTCEGEDVSPELRISGIPDGTETLALIVADPDAPAGTWVHWVEYDIPAKGPDVVVAEDTGPMGTAGLNSWNETGYGGPCPPPGAPHRYYFRVYALDGPLTISGNADSEALRSAMEGRILAEVELMGTFAR